MRRVFILLAAIVVLLVMGSLFSRSVVNRSLDSDAVVLTDNYSLNRKLDDSLFVFADTVELQADSAVRDDAALVGRQSVTITGDVGGDLTVIGDQLTLGENSHVDGAASFIGREVRLEGRIDSDLDVISSSLTISPDAQIKGQVSVCSSTITDRRAEAEAVLRCSDDELAEWQSFQETLQSGRLMTDTLGGGGFSGEGLTFSLFASLALTGLAALSVAIFPRQFSYLAESLRTLPFRHSLTGCGTLLLLPGGLAVLVVALAKVPVLGLILSALSCALALPFILLVVGGWIAVALLVGNGLVSRFSSNPIPPLVTVIAGSVALSIVWHMLTLLPFGVFISSGLMLVLAAAGLGAGLTTRFGNRRRAYFVQG